MVFGRCRRPLTDAVTSENAPHDFKLLLLIPFESKTKRKKKKKTGVCVIGDFLINKYSHYNCKSGFKDAVANELNNG